MPRPRLRGDGGVSVMLVIALGLGLAWAGTKLAPSIFDKRTQEARASANASAEVEKRVEQAVQAEQAKGAVVAASVQQIGVAAGQLPESPQRTFIVRESGWVAPLLPPPDPAALLAAERRRVAILEGKLDLADKLYARAAADNADLLARAVKAETRTARALADRREADTALAESAAYARGKDAVIIVLCAVAVICACLYGYVKLTGFGRADIARMANRIRQGMTGLEAIDATVPDWMHAGIKATAAKLAAKEAADAAARKAAAEHA